MECRKQTSRNKQRSSSSCTESRENDESLKLHNAESIQNYPSFQDKSISSSTYDLNIKPVSLINMGANCYLNAGLQAISACNYFVKEINELQSKYPRFKKLNIFRDLINVLKNGKEIYFNISRSSIFQEWNKPGQQDSFELLSYVINQVYDELRKEMKFRKTNLIEWFQVQLPLRIIMMHEIKCCPQILISSHLQSDLALHLAIFKEHNKSIILQNLLDSFFKDEKIEDYVCEEDQCDGSKAKKLVKLCEPLPNTICLHLQRLLWKNGMMNKIDDKVEFDSTIIIKKEFIVPQSGKPQDELQDREYQLTSLIVHYGTSSFGHYICYKIFDNYWYYTSDTSIRKVSFEDVKRCEAYILCYEIASSYRKTELNDSVTQLISDFGATKLNGYSTYQDNQSSTKYCEEVKVDDVSQKQIDGKGAFNNSYVNTTKNSTRETTECRNRTKTDHRPAYKMEKTSPQHNCEVANDLTMAETAESRIRNSQINSDFSVAKLNENSIYQDSQSSTKYCEKVQVNNVSQKHIDGKAAFNNFDVNITKNSTNETTECRNRTKTDHRREYKMEGTPPQHDYEVANNLTMEIFDQISDRSLSIIIHSLSACTNFVNRLKYFRSYVTSAKLTSFADKIISCDPPLHSKLNETTKHNEPDIFQSITSIMRSIFDEVQVNLQVGKGDNLVNFQYPMMILLESQIKCFCRNVISVPNQWEFALHLTDAYYDLQVLINKIFEDEDIRGYDCDGKNCTYKSGNRSTRMCRPLPETICIRVMNSGHSKLTLSQQIVIKSSFVTENKFVTDDKIRNTLDEQWYRQDPSSSLKYKLKSIISNAYLSTYECLRNYKNDWYLITGHNVTRLHGIESCKRSYLLLFEADTIQNNERLSMQVGAHTEIAREDYTNQTAKYKTRRDPFCLKQIGCDHYFDVCFQALSSCDKLINEMRYSTDFLHITRLLNYDVPADEMSRNLVNKWKRSYQTNLFQYMEKLLNDLFQECETKPIHGNVTITMKCSACKKVEEYDQTNLAFNIFINKDGYGTINLQTSIDNIFQVQNMSDHRCDNCSSRNVQIRKSFYRPYPKTLLIHVEHLIWEHTKNLVLSPNVQFGNFLLIPVVDESFNRSFINYRLKSILSLDWYGCNDYYTCYRKFDNQWYEITDNYFRYSKYEYDVLNCKPYLMFYELAD